jgi:streptogramin lyase
MRFSRVHKLRVAMMAASCASICAAPGVAQAQSEALTLSKYSAGFDATPAPHAPTSIAAGADGNMWFTDKAAAAEIGVITPDGTISYFTEGFSKGAVPGVITAGPDGNMWFTDTGAGGVGAITPNGTIAEYNIVEGGAPVVPTGIALGSDDNLWITESTGTQILKISAAGGGFTKYTAGISPSAGIQAITAGSDGNLWFTESGTNRIGSITIDGRIFEYGAGISPKAGLSSIVAGSDGNLWFMESATGKLGRITPSGAITEFGTGFPANAGPYIITSGSDGNLWVAEQFGGLTGNQNFNRIARITTSGVVTEFNADIYNLNNPGPVAYIAPGPNSTMWYTQTGTNFVNKLTIAQSSALSSAVLPGGRTVAPGAPATVFASMVNGFGNQVDNCSVGLPADAPLGMTLSYQTTNPATNTVTGTADTPFSIAGNGGMQSLYLTLGSPVQTSARGLQLKFTCNGASAAVVGGLNTVDANFVADSAPDNVVVAASATPGIISMSIPNSNAFGVAMQNAGGTDVNALTMVSVDTGLAVLPLSVTVCRTDPSTGACWEGPQPQQFFSLPAGAQATFSVFVTALGPVPFDPANNRIFIRFIDFDDFLDTYVSGSASVAVQTN